MRRRKIVVHARRRPSFALGCLTWLGIFALLPLALYGVFLVVMAVLVTLGITIGGAS